MPLNPNPFNIPIPQEPDFTQGFLDEPIQMDPSLFESVVGGGGGGNAGQAEMAWENIQASLNIIKMEQDMKKLKVVPYSHPVTPIIGEENEDGSKRLWKTRYIMLEDKYLQVSKDLHSAKQSEEFFEQQYKDEHKQRTVAQHELIKLKHSMVDMELVTKRLDQFITEFNLPLPKGPHAQSMDKRLEAFFGALWTRCRTEEVDDEVAS